MDNFIFGQKRKLLLLVFSFCLLLPLRGEISNLQKVTTKLGFFAAKMETLSQATITVLSMTCSGNADAVSTQTGVTDASNALGAPNGAFAQLYETNDVLVLDLSEVINAGETYTMRWRRGLSTSSNPSVRVEESSDNWNWTNATGSPFTFTNTSFFNQDIVANTDTRYLRITALNVFDTDLDGISYANVTCGGTPEPPFMLTNNLTCNAGANAIAGQVFEDYNFSGIYESSIEPFGIAGVVVTATDAMDNSTMAVTDGSGNYSLNGLTAGTTYRVEFTFPDSVSWAKPTIYQGDNGTTVQFLQPGNCANLGAAAPGDYCEDANPPILVSCFETGNATYGATGNENKGIIGFPYNSTGSLNAPDEVAKIFEVGTVWGLAWQASTQRMFSGAFLKRHSGFGPRGVGGVYVTDYSRGGGTVVHSFDLNGRSPANGGPAIDLGSVDRSSGADFILPNDNNTDNWDLDAFGKIGKISFGDVDISPDGRTLWLTNLHQNALISVDVSDSTSYPGTVNQYRFQTMSGRPSCSKGDLRPWGLAIRKNKGYVGCVCTGESNGDTGDIHAYVLSFDLNNPIAFTTEVDFPLNYTRENAIDFEGLSIGTQSGAWNEWADNWGDTGFSNDPLTELAYPQPILSDLDFLEDGSMVLGFSDRWGFQMGYQNYIAVSGDQSSTSGDVAGDIIKVCYLNGEYVLEGTGACTVNDNTSLSSLANDGPSNNGEFFYSDGFDDFNRNPTYNHNETFIGSLGVLRGTNEIVAAHYDPLDGAGFAFDLGLLWHDGATGARRDELRIIESGAVQSKGNNLGDLALVCAPAPLEIGNYVWLDNDGDGVQDPNEQPVAGIRMELYDANGTLVAFDTTDANGQYYFSKAGYESQVWTTLDARLALGQTYYVAVSGSQYSGESITINGNPHELTTDSTATGGNQYSIDNDAIIGSGFSSGLANLNTLPVTAVITGFGGENDHKLDFGFKPKVSTTYDYADLPDSGSGTGGVDNYEILDANGGPNHLIVPGLSLGATVDAEPDGQPSNDANGDGSDEDGIIIFPSLDISPGITVNLPLSVTNTTGDTAYVEAWIDWNGDGDFDDPNEMVVNLKDNADGNFPSTVSILVPENAVTGNLLGFLVRMSNMNNMTPTGRVNAGEVESYLIGIDCPQQICLPVSLDIKK